ncbi:hypothetical protein [Treponema pectinovorum]|uniref:hypothetical protein n=1 Tax=Treponema pectinovorum TaxID=164 RepID=UPI003D8AB7E5
MYKKSIILIFLLSVLFLAGCASSKVTLSDCSPIAILTVNGNATIYKIEDTGEINDESDGLINDVINKKFNISDAERLTAQDRVDFAADYLSKSLADIAQLTVIEREKVVASRYYKKDKNVFDYLSTQKSAYNYNFNMANIGSKNARLLGKEIGAKSLISLGFEFRKKEEILSRELQMVPVLVMNVNLYNSYGKILIKDSITLSGTKGAVIINSNYDRDEFVNLFPELIETAINQFIVSLL